MSISGREAQEAQRGGGSLIKLDPPGLADNPTILGIYHDPKTGQEFNLPATPAHIMWYMTGRKYGDKPLIFGPASTELKEKWATIVKVQPELEYMDEAKKNIAETEADATNQLLVVVQQLQKQVADLTAKVTGVTPPLETVKEVEFVQIEPKQLELF